MKSTVKEFIQSIEDAPSVVEAEREMGHETAKIRNRCKLGQKPGRLRVVAKLLYLDLVGVNTQFASIEIVSLMAKKRFSNVWFGYLGAVTLIDQHSDTILLITQTVINHLSSPDPKLQILALSAIANIGGPELTTAAVPVLQKMLDNLDPRVLKATIMACVRCIRQNPDFAESFRKFVPKLLNNPNHAVLLATIQMAIELLKTIPGLPKQWHPFIKPFMELLRDLKTNLPTEQTEFHLFNDPFLQIHCIKVLGLIGKKSSELDALLQDIISELDCHTVTARSILLQAAETISLTAKHPSLKTLAINQIGRLLGLNDSAVMYSALSAFSRLLMANNQIIDRSSSDSVAMQRYRSEIVHCLEHPDPSIRRRALDVISALINDTNIDSLVPEIMRYMKMVDNDFRSEIIPKVFNAIQRFSPTLEWNIETVLHLIIDNGNFVSKDIITQFIKLINNNQEIRPKALSELNNVMLSYSSNQPLVQIAAYVIGEFEMSNVDVIPTLLQIAVLPKTTSETACYIITALAKLAVRFDALEQIAPVIIKFSSDNRLEVQQRAGEVQRILQMPGGEEIYAPMQNDAQMSQQAEQAPRKHKSKARKEAPPQQQQEVAQEAPAPVPQRAPRQQAALSELYNQNEEMEDLLQIEQPQPKHRHHQPPPQADVAQQQQQMPTQAYPVPQGAIEAFSTSDVTTYFELQRNMQDPRQLAIRVSYFNKTKIPLNQFLCQYALPDGWALQAQRPTDNVLAPIGGPPIQQVLLLMNRGNRPLQMRAQVTFMFRSQPINTQVVVNNIF